MTGHFNPQPKCTRKARRANGVRECEIQAATDRLLQVMAVDYFRIPDAVYRTFKTGQLPAPGLRAAVLAELRGWPDNMLLFPLLYVDGVKYCLAPLVELKSATGDLHGSQKYMDARMGYNVCRDVSEVAAIVDKAKRMVKAIQKLAKIGEFDNCKKEGTT